MRIRAQQAMVLNLDKCLGCHTCSLPCKNVWTDREGAEYMWFNNVETKPGIGYPKRWENQELYKGGWTLKRGRPALRSGGPLVKLAKIFHNPDLPVLDEYYEPWTYDYGRLTDAPASKSQPSAKTFSRITGDRMDVNWGPNWEDDLAGTNETGTEDVNFRGLDAADYLHFESVFMFHLPRLCEHCLNPACAASCPSGALYKREEDGIVLVDQDLCRGWRYCVSGCPYKKVYFNWKTGRSEKCLFCYPRVETGQTTLCAHSCVGKIRYVGVVLYDADRVAEAVSAPDDKDLYEAQLGLMLDPRDPEVMKAAAGQGIPEPWLDAARRSPVYKLTAQWRLALPLHPEYRTLPMVWYVPPLSPVIGNSDETDFARLVEDLRIPIKYLANLLAAGDEGPVRRSLVKLTALRAWSRSRRVDKAENKEALEQAAMTAADAEEMYRLLALARYDERFVMPTAAPGKFADPHEARGRRGLWE